jgi:hypothetical protein
VSNEFREFINSLEVASLDLSDHFAGQISQPQFKHLARSYWRDSYTNIVLSDSILGGMVFIESMPIVITYLDWRTGNARSVLVDAAMHHNMQHIEDFSPEMEFSFEANHPAEIFLWKNWIGLLQVTKPNDLRYFLTRIQFSASETVSTGSSFPPFEQRKRVVAIGNNPDSQRLISLRKRTTNGRVDDSMILQLVSDKFGFSADMVIAIDFKSVYADLFQLERKLPGFYRLPTPDIQTHDLPQASLLAITACSSSSVLLEVEGSWQELTVTQYRPRLAKREARVTMAPEDRFTFDLPNDFDAIEGVFSVREYDVEIRLFQLM